MILKTTGMAGTLESSDVRITVSPNDSGIKVDLRSQVKTQFGDQMEKLILETLNELGVKEANVVVDDKGALDCVIKARLLTAVHRASEKTPFDWNREVFV